MSNLHSVVEIDGVNARLSDITESFAVFVGVSRTYERGDACSFTAFAKLMGHCVPVKFQGEVVRKGDDQIEVMFSPPTRNWERIFRALNRNSIQHSSNNN